MPINLHVYLYTGELFNWPMITAANDQKTRDFVNALQSIAVLTDIAKRDPGIIILAGLVLLFVGLLLVL